MSLHRPAHPRGWCLLPLLLPLGCTGKGPADSAGPGDGVAVDSGDSAVPRVSDERLVLGEPVECVSGDSVSWTERGEPMGLRGTSAPFDGELFHGGALGVEDFDADGDLDILVGWRETKPALFVLEDLIVEDVARFPSQAPISFSIADVDDDGLLDIFMGSRGRPAFLKNNGDNIFEQIQHPEWANQRKVKEFIPGDFDGDGILDFYALLRGSGDDGSVREDVMLWGEGDWAWTVDRAAVPVEAVDGVGFDAVTLDWDDDGDLDVYVTNDHGALYGPNALLVNNGDRTFRDASEDCTCGVTQAAMGVDARDYNGDGIVDLMTSDAHGNLVLRGLDDRSYVDVTTSSGLSAETEDVEMGWGVLFLDWDNDGDIDLLFAQGELEFRADDGKVSGGGANPGAGLQLWDNDGTGQFTEISESLGLDQSGNLRSIVATDMNGDGVLDLVAAPIRERPLVYLSDGCTTAGWIEVEGPAGSKVKVTDGERTQIAWITRESSLGSSGPAVVHFGLGAQSEIDTLEVELPGGETLRRFDFTANRRLTVELDEGRAAQE